MTKKQAKYLGMSLIWMGFLVIDKVFNMWKGWYVIDAVVLALCIWAFLDESE